MAKGKMKMLHLIRIISQETDDEHALTLQEIIAKLAAVNITADRKTLYNDFEDLRQFGFDIIAQQRDRTTYYHLGERDFELPELKLLVDSVQAAKFITTRKSRELIRKLERYTSIYQAAQLHRQVYIAGRAKAMNEIHLLQHRPSPQRHQRGHTDTVSVRPVEPEQGDGAASGQRLVPGQSLGAHLG